jgi:hypothetical protein
MHGTNVSLRKQDITSSSSLNASNTGSTIAGGVPSGGVLTDNLQNKLIAKHQMNLTLAPSSTTSGGIGPTNSFLTVKNAVNNGNSKNNNKAYMQQIKSVDEVIVDKRGGGGQPAHGNKSDATTAVDTSNGTSSLNQKSNEVFKQ